MTVTYTPPDRTIERLEKESEVTLMLEYVTDLSDEQLARCRELSHGDEGYMCGDLDFILEYEPRRKRLSFHRKATACLAYTKGHMVGWSLLQPVSRSPRWTVQLFVDPAYRRRGIGRLLLSQANYFSGRRPLVIKDEDNEDFFNKYPHLHAED